MVIFVKSSFFWSILLYFSVLILSELKALVLILLNLLRLDFSSMLSSLVNRLCECALCEWLTTVTWNYHWWRFTQPPNISITKQNCCTCEKICYFPSWNNSPTPATKIYCPKEPCITWNACNSIWILWNCKDPHERQWSCFLRAILGRGKCQQ